MTKKFMMLFAAIAIFGCLAWGASSYVGVVSDSMCGLKHSHASAAAAHCVASCVKNHGSKYVLVMHGKVYKVSPQSDFAKYPGQMVRVMGTMHGSSIHVTSVHPMHMGSGKMMKKGM